MEKVTKGKRGRKEVLRSQITQVSLEKRMKVNGKREKTNRETKERKEARRNQREAGFPVKSQCLKPCGSSRWIEWRLHKHSQKTSKEVDDVRFTSSSPRVLSWFDP